MKIVKTGFTDEGQPDLIRWNQRFREKPLVPPESCWVVQKYQYFLPDSGNALELACGRGGNALFLANRGLTTTAWDISDIALNQLADFASMQQLAITTHQCDLQRGLPEQHGNDVLVISHYLQRDILPGLSGLLNQGGLIYYQTFVKTSNPLSGPSRPEWRLDRGELPEVFHDFEILAYHEDDSNIYPPVNNTGLAAIVARKRD